LAMQSSGSESTGSFSRILASAHVVFLYRLSTESTEH